MARIYDIINRLENGNQKPKIRIDSEHEFTINNSKAAALKIMAESKKNNEEKTMDNIVKIALGKEAFDYIEGLDLSMPAYNTIVNTIMAAIADVELEEIEEEAEKQKKIPR